MECAAEKTMPISFVGDWCFSSQEQNDFVPVAELAGGPRTGSSQERDGFI
jgi:hypothetical protein